MWLRFLLMSFTLLVPLQTWPVATCYTSLCRKLGVAICSPAATQPAHLLPHVNVCFHYTFAIQLFIDASEKPPHESATSFKRYLGAEYPVVSFTSCLLFTTSSFLPLPLLGFVSKGSWFFIFAHCRLTSSSAQGPTKPQFAGI